MSEHKMTDGVHSFGPTCAYYEGESALPVTSNETTVPKIKAQFFYVSSLPIDDPLSPLPPIQTDSTTNVLPQPFSIRDNAALEEAWQEFQQGAGGTKDRRRPLSRGLNRMISFPKFRSGFHTPEITSPTAESSSWRIPAETRSRRANFNPYTASAPDIVSADPSNRSAPPRPLRRSSVRSNRSRNHSQSQSITQVMLNQPSDQQYEPRPVDIKELKTAEYERSHRGRSERSPPVYRQSRNASPISERSLPRAQTSSPSFSQTALDSDISGRPFARAPSFRNSASITADIPTESPSSPEIQAASRKAAVPATGPLLNKRDTEKMFVPVGVSRLHLVDFPDLQMKPIYWSPINDTSSVLRATWFYKDTMLPVPADVANRLEIGYEDMKPYTETYQDELNACIDHGAAAELKIVYKLWPEETKMRRPRSSLDDKPEEEEMSRAMEEEVSIPDARENAAADPRQPKKRKSWENYGVIYVNSRDAQILRPNTLPSVSKNRKPLNSIRKGRQIGIGVVRGFDRKLWYRLHPDEKYNAKVVEAKMGASMPQSGDATTRSRRASCPRCNEDDEKPKASDLVLVIHGIGQKLSERVDSFHFTHAINGLRREFNIELASNALKGTLRKDSGIMVLPVNWRLTLKLDDDPRAVENAAESRFGMKDITPETLPAIRSLISDVMLDIPYYMSHHKSKMISAVIREANRIYRLWCKNNPGFEDYGRVHLVAHSLGSVMAMEILSNQPTHVPADLDLVHSPTNDTIFEFDTSNLFCCGSPSAFFLLLNGANLVPRKGRNKPGTYGEDHSRGVASEAGRYGCLAVDNVYNICHRNDPIAYQQNACVDRDYAASIQQATIPSITQSLFGRIANSLRWVGPQAHDAYSVAAPAHRPHIQHMPSTVELETHDFSREEIAEKRMYLLNDNGQIDFFLSSGGGPLEIQYLNMLSAHSSYWILPDFARFLVVEIGRRPGKEHTIPLLRAVKKREYKRGNIV